MQYYIYNIYNIYIYIYKESYIRRMSKRKKREIFRFSVKFNAQQLFLAYYAFSPC